MKGTDFVKVIRKVVREEIRSVIKEELTEILREGLQSTIQEMSQPAATPKKKQTVKVVQQPRVPAVTMEGPLGDILRDTAQTMVNEGASFDDEWPDMNGGMFTTEQAPGMMSMMSALDEVPSKPNMRAAMTGDPTQAFVKDYSALLKKADELAQGKRN